MGARLYVGNLSYDTQEQGLRQLMEGEGRTVTDVHIVVDRETGRSRGFAFVELDIEADLTTTIQQLDGSSLDGRRLSVSEARPRRPREGGDRERGSSGGGRGGAGGGARFDRRPEPERQHRRPRFEGPRTERRGPPVNGPSGGGGFGGGGFGPPPDLATAGREEGRRRNKKWKDKSTEGEAVTPNREGSGRKKKGRQWDDDDW